MCLFVKEVAEKTGMCKVVILLPGSAFLCRLKEQENIVLCGKECNGCPYYIHKEQRCQKEKALLEGYSNSKKEKAHCEEGSQKNPICATC